MEITVTAEPVPLDTSLLEAAEEMLSRTPAASPFALSDDHEFKAAAPPKPPTDAVETRVYRTSGSGKPTLIGTFKPGHPFIDTVPAAPIPGSPESPYRKCSCLAVMPGRTCMRCLGSKWVKPCPKCNGQARIDMGRRKGADRSAPCGFCMASGQVSANRTEIAKAIEAATAAARAPVAPPAESSVPAFRRAARLPGIGSPEKKRKGKVGRRAKKAVAK